jgi:outer membrane protein TolC
MQTYYLPKFIGSYAYLHFNNPLGTVISTKGPFLPDIPVNVINQDASVGAILAAQPVTGLLKVREGVKAARADEQIALAQVHKATRLLSNGVEQLYLGLVAAQRLRGGAALAVRAAEQLAKTKTVEARLALIEAQQALQTVDNQVADLYDQLDALMDLPLGTRLELEEVPLPACQFTSAEQAAQCAVATSPDVQEAWHTVEKARAGVGAKKLDYLPDVNVVGGYINQNAASYIQSNIGFVGAQASFTLFEWGKRQHALHEMQTTLVMAETKLHQTEDEVRQKVYKLFREVNQHRLALKTAQDMAELRREMEQNAKAPAALMDAVKERMKAEVALVQADLAYRMSLAELANITERD